MKYNALFEIFEKSGKICNCPLLQIIGAALRDEIKVELAINNSVQIMSEMCRKTEWEQQKWSNILLDIQ